MADVETIKRGFGMDRFRIMRLYFNPARRRIYIYQFEHAFSNLLKDVSACIISALMEEDVVLSVFILN